jgi:hypothetical protein
MIENRAPFTADALVQIDGEGQELLLVIWSATFMAQTGGNLDLAETQTPIRFADEPMGDPAFSSTRYEADIAVQKPLVDVIVNGSAYAPKGGVAHNVMVGLKVADINKVLTVTGDRDWSFFGPRAPMPFRTMPIVYERAYGGTNKKSQADMRNPVGVGYRGARSADPDVKTEVANITYSNEKISRVSNHPRPAGFGVISRAWTYRLQYAGSYDQTWLDSRWPLLPEDFDPRYNQSAPEDQQSRIIRGGELVELTNLTPNRLWRFRLPKIDVPLRFLYDNRIEQQEVKPDTILIEPDNYRVTVTGRAAVRTVRNAPRLREVVIGHVSSAWLTARLSGKRYINYRGGDGTLLNRPAYLL